MKRFLAILMVGLFGSSMAQSVTISDIDETRCKYSKSTNLINCLVSLNYNSKGKNLYKINYSGIRIASVRGAERVDPNGNSIGYLYYPMTEKASSGVWIKNQISNNSYFESGGGSLYWFSFSEYPKSQKDYTDYIFSLEFIYETGEVKRLTKKIVVVKVF